MTLRDAATGQLLKSPLQAFPGIGGIVFSPDGRTACRPFVGDRVLGHALGVELGSFPFLSDEAMPSSLPMEIGSPESRILARRSS